MFHNVDNKYRPIPFWSWNENLNIAETKKQIGMMAEAGMGGFFMHARGGLETEYMSDEWFQNVSVSVDTAHQCGMYAWAYDENGWPSGFGNGIVNGFGEVFQQKYLRMEYDPIHIENAIYHDNGLHFYYEVNPFYTDNLNAEATKMFVREVYEPYYEKYGNSLEGFFTDEPQLSRNGIPWSHILPEAYLKEYGEELLPRLKELFIAEGSYKQTRIRFWRLVTILFSENFMKVIYDFCEEKGLKLTGHLVLEETPKDQLTCNGACMPHYEYFHIPGMDWLGRNIRDCLTSYQVASVAQQLGKKQVISECFALCGHNVSFDELKGLHEWNMVRGITLLCQHLEGYSLRGIRKRDYPPAMYYQQPWWEDYKAFNDAMSRIGMVLTEGQMECDTLVIHPQTSAWAVWDDDAELAQIKDGILGVMKTLEQKHIAFHLGDEILLERHGRVEGQVLILGNYRYQKIIVSHCNMLLDNTKELLKQFAENGGEILEAQDLPDNPICAKEITYTKRISEKYAAHYFVNSTREDLFSTIHVKGKVLDIVTGDLRDFHGSHFFEPFGSLLLIEEDCDRIFREEIQEIPKESMDLSGQWNIVKSSPNVLTLDFCDYYFDGKLQEEKGYVLNIGNRANALKRKVQIHQDYKFHIGEVPQSLYLVCETPESFEIKVNNNVLDKKDCGYFRDISFRMLDISCHIKQGENVISFDCDFVQSEQVYTNLERAAVFESEKNKLVFDMEIESIYLVGDFSVITNGIFEELDKDACRYRGEFIIEPPKKQVSLAHIERQGFPFFAGELTLSKTIELSHTNYVLKCRRKGVNVLKATINGTELPPLLWGQCLDISSYLVQGLNQLEITLVNNLRNMLGPHHLQLGESYNVVPRLFFKEECVWGDWGRDDTAFHEDYCFTAMGIVN